MRRRLALALTVPLIAATVAAAGGLPDRAEGQAQLDKLCPGSDAVVRSRGFTTIRKPPGIDEITAHAAGGTDGQILLASDGRLVMRSTDGGCTWKQAYEAPVAAGDVSPRITQLLFPEGSSTPYMILSGVADAAAPTVNYSPDGGETWAPRASGLPPAGRFREIVAAPDDDNVLYLIVGVGDAAGEQDPAGVTGSLYATTDGGESWEQRSTGVVIESLAVDPVGEDDLYAVRANKVVERSVDGGANWVALATPPDDDPEPPPVAVPGVEQQEPAEPWREISVQHVLPFAPVIALLSTATPIGSVTRGVLSTDLGKTWLPMDTSGLGPRGGLAWGRSRTQLYYASGSDSTAFHGPGFHGMNAEKLAFVDLDEGDLVSLEEPQNVVLTGGGAVGYRGIVMRRDAPNEDPPLPDALIRFDPPTPDPSEALGNSKECSDHNTPASPVKQPEVNWDPGQLDLKLQPGVPARAPLKAGLPAAPNPMDIYFLVDQSTSMDPAIEGLLCSLGRMVRELPRRGIDVHFGLGAYSDYYLNTYKRYHDISEPGPTFGRMLRTLYTFGGVHEPIRSALFQTATGAGLEASADDPKSQGPGRVNRRVPPGQQANWRENSTRVVLLIGDEPYEDSTEGEPAREEVVRVLKDKRALTVGIQVLASIDQSLQVGGDQSALRRLQLRQQMEYFARETNAIGPRGGVDCDGGGAPDVAAGAPLVCSIREAGIQRQIDETLIAILRGIEDRQDVRIVPGRSEGPTLQVEGGEYSQLNVKQPNDDLAATGILSCSTDQAGRKYDVEFDLMVGNRRVGRLPGRVQCGEIAGPAVVVPPTKPRAAKAAQPTQPFQPAPQQPATAPVPPPAPPAAPQVAAVAPPPSPPPAPAPAGQVQPTSASATQAAAAPAPGQGAGAAQEQRSLNPTVALIDSGGGEGHVPLAPGGELKMTDYSMTALRARPREAVPVPALVTLGVGGAAAFVLFGVGVGRRRKRWREVELVRASR